MPENVIYDIREKVWKSSNIQKEIVDFNVLSYFFFCFNCATCKNWPPVNCSLLLTVAASIQLAQLAVQLAVLELGDRWSVYIASKVALDQDGMSLQLHT